MPIVNEILEPVPAAIALTFSDETHPAEDRWQYAASAILETPNGAIPLDKVDDYTFGMHTGLTVFALPEPTMFVAQRIRMAPSTHARMLPGVLSDNRFEFIVGEKHYFAGRLEQLIDPVWYRKQLSIPCGQVIICRTWVEEETVDGQRYYIDGEWGRPLR